MDVIKETVPSGHVRLRNGTNHQTGRYCAPLRCYCHDPACTARKPPTYTTADLHATARREAARLRDAGVIVEEVPPWVKARAAQVFREGAPLSWGCEPHLTAGYVNPASERTDAATEGEPTGMRVSTRTKRQVARRG